MECSLICVLLNVDTLLLLRSYYNKQWIEAQRMITDLSQLDVSPEEAKPEQVCTVGLVCQLLPGFKKPSFKKNPNRWVFWVLLGFPGF